MSSEFEVVGLGPHLVVVRRLKKAKLTYQWLYGETQNKAQVLCDFQDPDGAQFLVV